MNRTDRLYALVEELRAIAPRGRTARQLAERFEVSVRTIERDLSALQQAGVPIWATSGPGGGYALDPAMTLPPLNFTSTEAVAIAVALQRAGPMPFARDAQRAFRKLAVAMSDSALVDAHALADRVRLLVSDVEPAPTVPDAVERAVLDREVIEIDYEDRVGTTTCRVVEPVGLVGSDRHWYLVAWCRTRDAARSFRVDRIRDVRPTGSAAPDRPFDLVGVGLPEVVRPMPPTE